MLLWRSLRPGSLRFGTGFDLPAKQSARAALEQVMAQPGFWDNPDKARGVVSQISGLKAVIEPVVKLERTMADTVDLFALAEEEKDAETLDAVDAELASLSKECDRIEVAGMLSGPDDMRACFFSIHAGAGGTESCDWANMLLRMYTRYFEENKFSYEQMDITPGEEAGIRSLTLRVSGPFAFGKLSCEKIGRAHV